MTYSMDPYKVLGIPHDASDEDIKKAYKKAALQHHPDRRNNNVGDDKACSSSSSSCYETNRIEMAVINEAYSILKDKEKKKEYDHLYRYGGAWTVTDFSDGENIHRGLRHNNKNDHGDEKHNDDDDIVEIRFQINPGSNPFMYMDLPKRKTTTRMTSSSFGGTAGSSGSFAFAFSSMTTQTAKDRRSMIYTRKYTQYLNGWKHTQIETATVDEFGNTVYKRSMMHEKGTLQNIRDAFSSLIKQNPIMSSRSSKVDNARGRGASSSFPQTNTTSEATMSSNRNHNGHGNGWFRELVSQVRKCTGSCGGLLCLSD